MVRPIQSRHTLRHVNKCGCYIGRKTYMLTKYSMTEQYLQWWVTPRKRDVARVTRCSGSLRGLHNRIVHRAHRACGCKSIRRAADLFNARFFLCTVSSATRLASSTSSSSTAGHAHDVEVYHMEDALKIRWSCRASTYISRHYFFH